LSDANWAALLPCSAQNWLRLLPVCRKGRARLALGGVCVFLGVYIGMTACFVVRQSGQDFEDLQANQHGSTKAPTRMTSGWAASFWYRVAAPVWKPECNLT